MGRNRLGLPKWSFRLMCLPIQQSPQFVFKGRRFFRSSQIPENPVVRDLQDPQQLV